MKHKRSKSTVTSWPTLIWALYRDNPAIKHAITVFALALTVIGSTWISHNATTASLNQVIGTQRQLSDRIDTLSTQTAPAQPPSYPHMAR